MYPHVNVDLVVVIVVSICLHWIPWDRKRTLDIVATFYYHYILLFYLGVDLDLILVLVFYVNDVLGMCY